MRYKKLLEILKNHFLSSARFRSALPHYIAKKEMIEINEQTTTKVKYPLNFKLHLSQWKTNILHNKIFRAFESTFAKVFYEKYLSEDWINHQDEHPIEIKMDVPSGIYRLKEGEV